MRIDDNNNNPSQVNLDPGLRRRLIRGGLGTRPIASNRKPKEANDLVETTEVSEVVETADPKEIHVNILDSSSGGSGSKQLERFHVELKKQFAIVKRSAIQRFVLISLILMPLLLKLASSRS